MPYGGGITVGGWISIIVGVVILAVLVFGLLQSMRLMNSIRSEISDMKNEVDRIREDVEEIRRKLEEI